jgi:hypothetical protein
MNLRAASELMPSGSYTINGSIATDKPGTIKSRLLTQRRLVLAGPSPIVSSDVIGRNAADPSVPNSNVAFRHGLRVVNMVWNDGAVTAPRWPDFPLNRFNLEDWKAWEPKKN